MIVTIINCLSVHVSSKINSIFSIGKILALILIIIFGIINLFKGNKYLITFFLKLKFFLSFQKKGSNRNLKFDMQKSEKDPLVYATAFYYGLFTYDGWFALNNLVEEMKNPKR